MKVLYLVAYPLGTLSQRQLDAIKLTHDLTLAVLTHVGSVNS